MIDPAVPESPPVAAAEARAEPPALVASIEAVARSRLLKVGVDTRESVEATVGRPATEALLKDEAWYYVQSHWKTIGAGEPVEVTREVVAISFDAKGLVSNIERFGLDQGRIVPLSRRVTTTNIRGKGILAQIFGNIGKLNTDNLFK